MVALAEAVAGHAPGLMVRGATLASEGSLEAALAGLCRPMVYPFFMAEGYFTTDVLPARISATGRNAEILPAFGSDPALPALIAEAAMEGASAHGFAPSSTTLVLAAHGSQVSPASKQRTLDLVRRLKPATSFESIVTGFIEEEPFLHDAARGVGQALCLPLFTLQAGHVTDDIPAALKHASFEGVLLPHIGAHPALPAMIAASLTRDVRKAAA